MEVKINKKLYNPFKKLKGFRISNKIKKPHSYECPNCHIKYHSRKALRRHSEKCYLKGKENLQPRLMYYKTASTKGEPSGYPAYRAHYDFRRRY
jgi:protein-arginine kinase activator protein McsA